MTQAAKPAASGPIWPTAVLLAVTLLAAAFALLTTLRVMAGLPIGQYAVALATERLQQVERDQFAAATGGTRDAWLACEVAKRFSSLLRGQLTPELEQQLSAVTNQVRGSAVGRLELLGLRLNQLERAGRDADAAWPDVRSLLTSLEFADFKHGLAPLLGELARGYAGAALRPGTAATLARERYGYAYGPFVQFLAARLDGLAEQRRAAGDPDGAGLARAVELRWLRQWTLEPAPIGLRMLAAESLERALPGTGDASSAPATAPALASALNAWRGQLRTQYLQQPPDILMAFTGDRTLAADALSAAIDALVLFNWTAAAFGMAAFLMIVSVWFAFGEGPQRRALWRTLLTSGGFALGLVLAGALWALVARDWLRVELRGDFSALRYVWWHVVIAAGLSGVTLIGVSVPGVRKGRLARLGGRCLGATLWLAILLTITGYRLNDAVRAYERETAAAIEQSYGVAAPPELLAWSP